MGAQKPMRPRVSLNHAQGLWQVVSQYGLHHFFQLDDAESFAEWASEPRQGAAPMMYPPNEEAA